MAKHTAGGAVKSGETSPVRCPYCKGLFNTFNAWRKDHYPKCHAQWVKRRAMERNARTRGVTQPIENPFEGLDKGE